MSDYVTHWGKFRKLVPQENETLEQQCLRLWIEDGEELEDFSLEDFKWGYDSKKLLFVNDELWEIFEDNRIRGDDDYVDIGNNGDGTFSFKSRFYNGGTCIQEILEAEIKKLKE